jgi:hypothetical protein
MCATVLNCNRPWENAPQITGFRESTPSSGWSCGRLNRAAKISMWGCTPCVMFTRGPRQGAGNRRKSAATLSASHDYAWSIGFMLSHKLCELPCGRSRLLLRRSPITLPVFAIVQLQYPQSLRGDQVDTHHGIAVADHYRSNGGHRCVAASGVGWGAGKIRWRLSCSPAASG